MTSDGRVRLTRALVSSFLGAIILATLGVLAQSLVVSLFAVGLAAYAMIGASGQRASRLVVKQNLGLSILPEDDPLPIGVAFQNQGRRKVFAEWRMQLPSTAVVVDGVSGGFDVIGRHRSVTSQLSAAFPLFGLRRVGGIRVRVGDPFGFAYREFQAGEGTDVRVVPAGVHLHDAVMSSRRIRLVMGAYEVAQPGDGFEFFGLRDYSPGDRPRDINWKASARRENLIVNQHQRENDTELVLFVDARAATNVGLETQSAFARTGRAAKAIAEAHLKSRDAVRLVAYGDTINEDHHTGALRRLDGIIDLLIATEPKGDMPMLAAVEEVLPRMQKNSPVIIVSSLVGDATIEDAVSLLRVHDFKVLVVAPAPDWGGGAARPATDAWAASQLDMVRKLRRLGLPVVHWMPGDDLERSIQVTEVA